MEEDEEEAEEAESDDEDSHLSKLAPRVVDKESVMMAVSAMPSANKMRCHTTTSTLDNTCNESFVPVMFFSCIESSVFRHVLFSEDRSHLLHDDVAGEQEGDCDSNHKEDVVPALLRAPGKGGNVDMDFLKETLTCP